MPEVGDPKGGTRGEVVRPSQRREMARNVVAQQGLSIRLATANASFERYNGTVRYDWLGQYLFESIAEVRMLPSAGYGVTKAG